MSREYCDYIIDLLSDWGQVSAKSMFGGYGMYRQGQIFAIIADDTLYFKVDEQNRSDYEAAESQPFFYEAKGKKISMSYWLVPTDVMDDPEILAQWAEKSYHVGLRSRKK